MPETVIRGSTLTNGFRGNHPTAHAGISIQENKTALRRQLRSLRQQLAIEERDRLSLSILNHLLSSPLTLHASSIGLYLPTDNEVNTLPFLQAFWQAGKQTFVPVVGKNHTMGFFPVRPEDPLRPSPLGIREPPVSGRDEWSLTRLDLLLLPLVGFDACGGRMGFGGGYFDRLLDNLSHPPPWRVGLAYSFQEVARLPQEPHDIPMHGVVTELGLRWFTPPPANDPPDR